LEKDNCDDNTFGPLEPSSTSGHKEKGKAAKETEAGELSKGVMKGKSVMAGKAVTVCVKQKKVKQASAPDIPKAASKSVTMKPMSTTVINAAPTIWAKESTQVSQSSLTGTSTLTDTLPKKDMFQFPPKLTNIVELPSTIAALENLLPKLQVNFAVDSIEEDDEEVILLLALAAVPDMPRYLEKNLELLKTLHCNHYR
jgi:hypothetical protein